MRLFLSIVFIATLANGIAQNKADLKKDPTYQEYVTYYPNKIKESEGIFINGTEHGTWKFYHENGK